MPTYFERHGHTIITLAAVVAAFVGVVTINGNRFDAQDRRLDAQDKLIGQLFELVNQRLDAQDRLINRHFEGVNRQFEGVNQQFEAVNRHFEAVSQRLDSHDRHLERLTGGVSELRRLMVGISERVSRNEGEIDVIREQLRIADTPSP